MESVGFGDVDQVMALAKNMDKVAAELDPKLSKMASDACPGKTINFRDHGAFMSIN
jgi:hypothetical protein